MQINYTAPTAQDLANKGVFHHKAHVKKAKRYERGQESAWMYEKPKLKANTIGQAMDRRG